MSGTFTEGRSTDSAGACVGKMRFESAVIAKTVRDRMARPNRRRAKRTMLTVYRCRHCHGWHIGGH